MRSGGWFLISIDPSPAREELTGLSQGRGEEEH